MYTWKKKKKKKEEMNGCFVVSSMIAVRRLRLFAKYFFSLERFSLLFLLLLFDTFRRDTQDDKKTDLPRKNGTVDISRIIEALKKRAKETLCAMRTRCYTSLSL